MTSDHDPDSDKAVESVEGLLKTIIATAGILLALLWGLTQRDVNQAVLLTVRWASIVLTVSIIMSFLGLQFIVTQLEREVYNITKQATVAFSFYVAWISFICGCVLLIIAIFRV